MHFVVSNGFFSVLRKICSFFAIFNSIIQENCLNEMYTSTRATSAVVEPVVRDHPYERASPFEDLCF